MQKRRSMLLCLLISLVLSIGLFATSFTLAGAAVDENKITVLNGASANNPVSLVNAPDTLSISTKEYYGDSGASIRYNLNAAGPNEGRGFHIFPNDTDLSEYNAIQVTVKATEIIEYGFIGVQLFCGGMDVGEGVTVNVPGTADRPTTEWTTLTIDTSEYQSQMDNVGRVIFVTNVIQGKEAATTLYIDSIKAVQLEGGGTVSKALTLADAASLWGIGLSNAGNDTVSTAKDGTLQYNISATGPNEGRGIHFFPRTNLQGVTAIEMEVKALAVIPYSAFGYQIYYGGTDGGYQNTADMQVETVLTETRPTTDWTTITVDISTLSEKYDNVGRIIFTCNLTPGEEAAATLYIRSIKLVKGDSFVGSDGIDPNAGEELPENENIAPMTILDGTKNVDGVNGSDSYAGDGFILVHPSEEKLSISTDVVYGESTASVKYEMPGTSKDVGRGFHINMQGADMQGTDLRGYDRIEVIAKAEKDMIFGFVGVQILYGGKNNEAINMPLNIVEGTTISTEWALYTVDISSVSSLFANVGRIIWVTNVQAGNTEDNVIYYDSIRIVNDDYYQYVAYDGTELVSTDLSVDQVSITEEYVKNADSALLFEISGEQTVGHNLVFPVNYDCSRFNQLEITMYISDWGSFSYFGWQLQYSEVAQGGLTMHELEGMGSGWMTVTYDLTGYEQYLDLINLLFTVNFAEGQAQDMFIAIENITFRVAEEPATQVISLADKTPPRINYIKYYNLENKAEIGDEIDLSGITVTDNEDLAPVMTIEVTKEGNRIELTDDKKFTITEAGTYTVKLVATDATGNTQEVTLTFTAEAAQDGETSSGCSGMLGGVAAVGIAGGLIVLAAAAVLLRKRNLKG